MTPQSLQLVSIGISSLASAGLLLAIAQSFQVGLVSDDFFHLSSDQDGAWYYSSDHLYRPLRNGLFKFLGAAFGVNPLAYRITTSVLYLLCGFLWYRLVRRLGFSGQVAAVALFLVFFNPRNDALLYWFAAMQDLVMAAGVLASILCWIEYRVSGQAKWLASSAFAFGIALGFKETAVVAVGLIATIDWMFLREKVAALPFLRRISPYLAFGIPAILFAWFVWWYPDGQFRATREQQTHIFYGMTSLAGPVLGEVRSFLNVLTPFATNFGLRGIGAGALVALALSAVTILYVWFHARNKWIWIWAGIWAAIAFLPTSVFARGVADYYLLVGGMGIALAVAVGIEDASKSSRVKTVVAAALIGCYIVAGTAGLVRKGKGWERSSAVASDVVLSIAEHLKTDAERASILNVPHNVSGVPCLNNGLPGALAARGIRPGTMIRVNFRDEPHKDGQNQLIERLARCSRQLHVTSKERVIFLDQNRAHDVTGECAANVAQEDFTSRPSAWHERTAR